MLKAQLNFDPNLPAVKVIGKWGSNNRFAAAVGLNPSTTYRYLLAGHFVASKPGELMTSILAAARRDGITLEPQDFVDLRDFGRTS